MKEYQFRVVECIGLLQTRQSCLIMITDTTFLNPFYYLFNFLSLVAVFEFQYKNITNFTLAIYFDII